MRSIRSTTKPLCWVLAFSLCYLWSGLPEYLAYAQETPQKVSYEEAVKQLDDFFRSFERLQAGLDRSEFDVEAKAKALGRDMQAIFEFVRDQVRYEAYAGVLRGARGTLIGLAGNSLDQSLLLAELLRHNGFQVQFVRGTLDDATAKRLIKAMLQAPVALASEPKADLPQSSSERDDAGLSPAEYQKLVAAQEMERQTFLEDLLESVQTDFQAIKSALQEQNIILGGDRQAEEAQLLAETKDHFWVQVQHQGQWIDLDTCFRETQPGTSFASGTAMTGIPDTLHHTLTFEITVEQKKGEGLQRQTALSKTFKVANLAVSSIQFANVPNNADAGLEKLEQATRFLPVLVINGQFFHDQGFDLQGNLIPAATFTSGAGKIGGGLSDMFGQMSQRLEGMGGEQREKASLTGEWISFIVRGPTGEKRIYERELLDRIGIEHRTGAGAKQIAPQFRDEKKVKYILVTSRQILISSFHLNRLFLLNEFSDEILAKRSVLYQTAKIAYQKEPGDSHKVFKEMAKNSQQAPPLQLLLLIQGSETFAQLMAPSRDATPIFYADRPNIFLYKTSMDLDSAGHMVVQEGIDIVENRLKVISTPNTAVASDEFHLLISLVQAYLERTLVKTKKGKVVEHISQFGPGTREEERLRVLNTVDVFAEARRTSVQSIVLTPEKAQVVETLQLSQEAKTRIRQDLNHGFIAVGLRQNVTLNGQSIVGWWRIEPTSGHLIGRMISGEGASLLEEIMLNAVLLGPIFIYGPLTYVSCAGTGDKSAKKGWLCFGCAVLAALCAEVAWLSAIITAGGGAPIAAAVVCGFGTSTATLFVCTAIEVFQQ